jgi:two-component system, LytTR family, sensor kinase
MKTVLKRLAIAFAAWTLLALLWAASVCLHRVTLGLAPEYVGVLRESLSDYWIWATLTPLIFFLAERFPFTRINWGFATLIHTVFYLALTTVHEAVAQWIGLSMTVPATFHGSLLRLRIIASLYNDLWMYWPIVVIWSLYEYYQRYLERDTRAALLKEKLARAELQALRNQLHPHFLFNTLNSVVSLMHENVQAADDMLGDLSYLLRASLSENEAHEITLRQEVALLECYLRIQKRRFEDRLSASLDIPDDLGDAAVPPLLLQPLVENAILHGIAPSTRGGTVRIRASREKNRLRLEVTDDGAGLKPGHTEGIGLSNTRARLRQLYGDEQSFELSNLPAGGVAVRLALPLRIMATGTRTDFDDNSDHSRRRRTSGAPPDPVVTETR